MEEFHLETHTEERNGLHLSENGNSNLVQTRQMKRKSRNNCTENGHAKFDNSSFFTSSVVSKDDDVSKNTKSDLGTKLRKPLFTPNYKTDLSVAATDETSDSEDVANFPLDEHMRKSHQNLQISELQCSNRGVQEDQNHLKRDLCAEVEEDDVETVVNYSLEHNKYKLKLRSRKNMREELSESCARRNVEMDFEVTNVDFEKKSRVAEWLNHTDASIPPSSQQSESIYIAESSTLRQIIDHRLVSQDLSCLLRSEKIRMRGYLLDVVPDPSINPHDLVSGFCQSGCQKMFLFSVIKWIDGENIRPVCPECLLIELEKELVLVFMMEMLVLEENGKHTSVIVMKDHAEHFFNCSVKEFLQDQSVRNSRVKRLVDYTLRRTAIKRHSPLLDITVVLAPGNSSHSTLVLVDSTLADFSKAGSLSPA